MVDWIQVGSFTMHPYGFHCNVTNPAILLCTISSNVLLIWQYLPYCPEFNWSLTLFISVNTINSLTNLNISRSLVGWHREKGILTTTWQWSCVVFVDNLVIMWTIIQMVNSLTNCTYLLTSLYDHNYQFICLLWCGIPLVNWFNLAQQGNVQLFFSWGKLCRIVG